MDLTTLPHTTMFHYRLHHQHQPSLMMTGPSPDQLLLQGVPELTLLPPDPHHQLLLSLLQETSTLRPYAGSLPTYSVYTFPCILLLEPPPVWTPMPPAPIGYRGGETRPPSMRRTATAASSHESPHQPLVFPPADPAHQYLRSLTEALSKAGTLETLKTHPTLRTSPSNGDTSQQRTAHQSVPRSTERDAPPTSSVTPRPFVCRRRATRSRRNHPN